VWQERAWRVFGNYLPRIGAMIRARLLGTVALRSVAGPLLTRATRDARSEYPGEGPRGKRRFLGKELGKGSFGKKKGAAVSRNPLIFW